MNRIAVWKQQPAPRNNRSKLFGVIAGFAVAIVALWLYRHYLVPQSSTVWLKVLGYGIVPMFLAYIGDHFAAEAIKDQRKRRMYRAFFLLVSVCAVALIAIVENKAEEEHKQEQQRVAQMLSTVSSNVLHPPPNPEHEHMSLALDAIGDKLKVPPMAKVIVQQPPAPKIPLTTEERFRAMKNSELRDYTLQWANKLRDFEKDFLSKEYTQVARPPFSTDPAMRERIMQDQWTKTIQFSMDHENEFQKYYWGETHSLYAELKNRFDATGMKVPDPTQVLFAPGGGAIILETINEGRLVGPSPIENVANYLEILARALPVH